MEQLGGVSWPDLFRIKHQADLWWSLSGRNSVVFKVLLDTAGRLR
jgi:hypothetical protein